MSTISNIGNVFAIFCQTWDVRQSTLSIRILLRFVIWRDAFTKLHRSLNSTFSHAARECVNVFLIICDFHFIIEYALSLLDTECVCIFCRECLFHCYQQIDFELRLPDNCRSEIVTRHLSYWMYKNACSWWQCKEQRPFVIGLEKLTVCFRFHSVDRKC